MTIKTESGVAIILVLLVTSFLSAVGLGLALVVFMDQLASGNHRGSVAMLYAADAGIELAARDLALAGDWDGVLAGTIRGSFTDGAPTGVRGDTRRRRREPDGRNQPAELRQAHAPARRRKWTPTRASGPGAPTTRDGGCTPMDRSRTSIDVTRPVACYLAVWVADDGREEDDDPLADAAVDEPGRGSRARPCRGVRADGRAARD